MAVIKSTMEMVLERASRLATDASAVPDNEESMKIGMHLAAEFMAGRSETPLAGMEDHPSEKQKDIRRGAVQVLLRNVVLPRDEQLRETAERALQALQLLDGNEKATITIQELNQILGQYNTHLEQSQQQLDDAIRAQLQQQAVARGMKINDEDINPAMHPKYAEELHKLQMELNGQYNDAMDERKQTIGSCFGLN
ncbi:hypothetical protein JWG39_00920 [Desulforhopalus vacuolatus]|uniref:hypothetical protein n=1 Tax=Desulforhopalus vacuolatus TaxID=40414 RepID=UPI00196313ED|nr:hypothetical protein [Desulforhopalus vacuolatus]MBM9518374.1 hypothetical protein [Desulforhopalus vacuolatus]